MIASAVVSQPYLRASIYDVRTEGGGGSNNAPNLRSKRVDFADGEGLGEQKISNFCGPHVWKPPRQVGSAAYSSADDRASERPTRSEGI